MRETLASYTQPIVVGAEMALFGHALARGASPWLVAFSGFLVGFTLIIAIRSALIEQDTRRVRFERELVAARRFPRAIEGMERSGQYQAFLTTPPPPPRRRHDA